MTTYGPLSYVEFNILLALARSDMHGYGIMKDAEERTSGAVSLEPGNLYRALRRMEAAGWVARSDRRPDPDQAGARRTYYTLTRLGREVAAAETERMAALVETARSRRIALENV